MVKAFVYFGIMNVGVEWGAKGFDEKCNVVGG